MGRWPRRRRPNEQQHERGGGQDRDGGEDDTNDALPIRTAPDLLALLALLDSLDEGDAIGVRRELLDGGGHLPDVDPTAFAGSQMGGNRLVCIARRVGVEPKCCGMFAHEAAFLSRMVSRAARSRMLATRFTIVIRE